ncbi:lipopolysaccharide biosynthesis protein [Microbacterium sp. A94]|uniref:lipopolysaccharide biosynthesis protein n=1 Tax=Microbacterium sp. A94 TaxID=3450717 RepID=UPI003F43EBA8
MSSLLAVGARALTMVIALICGILTTRMIIADAGVDSFALYTLLTTIPSLLTFTDLGSGAVLVNAVAISDNVRSDEKLRYQLTSVGRVLLAFAASAMAINTVLVATGTWELILGDVGERPGASLAAFYCVTIFCLSIPMGVWVRIMLGQRRNHVVILLQGLISPLTLLGVWSMLNLGAERLHVYLGIASFAASLVVSALGVLITARSTSPLIPAAARMVLRPRRFPGVTVMDVGWPMLAQMVTYPIAVGSQRYIIAQLGGPSDVAEYGVAGQVFFALNGLVMAGGLALWPHFARRRHEGALNRGPFLLSALFAVAIAVATVMVWLVGPWLFDFITQGALVVEPATIFAFGLMIMMTAAVYPLGMFIMDKPGIRFQVIPTLSMAVIGVGLALVLTPVLGIVGPLLGVSFALVVCQLIPFSIYIVKHRSRLTSGAQTAVGSAE